MTSEIVEMFFFGRGKKRKKKNKTEVELQLRIVHKAFCRSRKYSGRCVDLKTNYRSLRMFYVSFRSIREILIKNEMENEEKTSR